MSEVEEEKDSGIVSGDAVGVAQRVVVTVFHRSPTIDGAQQMAVVVTHFTVGGDDAQLAVPPASHFAIPANMPQRMVVAVLNFARKRYSATHAVVSVSERTVRVDLSNDMVIAV